MGKQKRSENTYQKINTIFMRDAKNVIMPYEPFTEPEFEYLRSLKWRGEEKIDGTNMRIEVKSSIEYKQEYESNIELVETDEPIGVRFDVRIAGKTDNAQIPKNLLKHMEEKYPKEKVLAALGLKEFIPVDEWETEHNWLSCDQIPKLYTIYGEGYGAGLSMWGAILVEIILTFVFIYTILGVTSDEKKSSVAGIVIGLTLAFVHIMGIPLTGTSVNPARSIAPAIFLGGQALKQVWVFIVAPLIGSALASYTYKFLNE